MIEKAYGAGLPAGDRHPNTLCSFMQESRSFDHYFRTLSGTDGFNTVSPLFQQGLEPDDANADATGVTMPYPSAPPGRSLDDACVNDLTIAGWRCAESWNGGVNDNWLPAQAKTHSAAHTPGDGLLRQDIRSTICWPTFTVCDRYFCSVLGPYCRLYWLSATIDPDGQMVPGTSYFPTGAEIRLAHHAAEP